jgi:hypothetical protein
MECPLCSEGCPECDHLGYWWIIPTSGHRAYPSTYMHLDCVTPQHVEMMKHSNISNVQDHYKVGPSPKLDIKSLFRATQEPKQHIARRL